MRFGREYNVTAYKIKRRIKMVTKSIETFNLGWSLFEMYNEYSTKAFEQMCLDLFKTAFVQEGVIPHINPNNPGLETDPVPSRYLKNGKTVYIGFQSKYFSSRIQYAEIKDSLKNIVENYAEKVNRVYLFCNKTISNRTKSYKGFADVLAEANIELFLITNQDIFVMLRQYPDIANRYFKNMNQIHTDNELYKNAFLEPLFLHKQKLPNNHKVCLKNLFIFQNYCKEGSHRKYTNTRQYLIDFIENGNKMLLVEGNAGSGKSSLVSWMGYHYESRDKTSERVFGEKHLVIIRLRELDRALINGKSLIPALLAYMNVESIDKFAEIFPKAVIVLDGFDELCMIEKVTNQTQLIEDCIKRIPQDAKLIITTRLEYVKELTCTGDCRIILQHFDKNQRSRWLRRYISKRYCGQELDSYMHSYIEQIDEWTTAAVCDTPMTLYMIAASGISKEYLTNCWSLYWQIFSVYITETEYNRMFPNAVNDYSHDIVQYSEVLYRITEEIAFEMYRYQNNKFYLTREEVDNIIERIDEDEHLRLTAQTKVILQKCYALNSFWKERSSDGAVEFYHNNIRDFFMCEKILRDTNRVYNLLRTKKITREKAIEKLIDLFANLFQYDLLNSIVSTFIMYRERFKADNLDEFAAIENKERLLPILFERIIVASSFDIQKQVYILGSVANIYRYAYNSFLKKDELIKWWNDVNVANTFQVIQDYFQSIFLNTPVMDEEDNPITVASNADFSGVILCEKDLRNIGFYKCCFRNAQLRGAKLEGSSFENADLSNADLRDADIHYSSLENANLTDADLRGSLLRGTELPDGFCSDNEEEQKAHLMDLIISGMKI